LVRAISLRLNDILCYISDCYVVSGGGRCILGSDQVQVTPGTISRPRKYNNIAYF
jgi:hypothetical protein